MSQASTSSLGRREKSRPHITLHLGCIKECLCICYHLSYRYRQAMFWLREQKKTGKFGEVDVREDHGGMSGSEERRFLEFRMYSGQKIRKG